MFKNPFRKSVATVIAGIEKQADELLNIATSELVKSQRKIDKAKSVRDAAEVRATGLEDQAEQHSLEARKAHRVAERFLGLVR